MEVSPLGHPVVQGAVENSVSPQKNDADQPTDDGVMISPKSDKVVISDEAREKAANMKSGAPEKEGEKPDTDGMTLGKRAQSGGSMGSVDKEEAVDELEDTNSDIKKKKDKIQEMKTSFVGSEDEKAQKMNELKQDLLDLEDKKKELQSTLAS